MTPFEDILKVFAFDLKREFCIEIQFYILNDLKFNNCWMGKISYKNTKQDIYWFGLTEDGQNAYDYNSFNEMSEAKVFDGKSLKEIWSNVELELIDGCDPKERITFFIK